MMTRNTMATDEIVGQDQSDGDREQHGSADDREGPYQRADQAFEEERLGDQLGEVGEAGVVLELPKSGDRVQ